MEKTQIYLSKEDLKALRAGPIAIWDGEPRRPSAEHDSIYDNP